ncbi:MAG: hypothetical protein V3S33_05720 [Gammaproteobacteria bacterium]
MTNQGGVGSTHGIGMAIHATFDNTGNLTGSHTGPITGAENPQYDTWEFFGNTGMDYLSSPMTDLGTDGSGNHLIDMSGWTVSWNGIDAISMGGDSANFPSDTGIGIMSCSTLTCSASSTFVLAYNAHGPGGGPAGYGGTPYALHLEGTIGTASAVPVPSAVWLFGSGLIGLIGIAKKRKAT